jgi:flagellar export protein FliJ
MSKILEHLKRLREHEKKQAHLGLSKAEREEQRQLERMEAHQKTVEEVRENCQVDDPAEVARYHAFRLKMEMVRRRDEARLERCQTKVDQSRDKLTEKVKETRTLETLIENRAEAEAAEKAKKDGATLDELGIQGWKRKTA